jgi:hypothetical protein
MFAFSLGPLSLEELEALEAKEKETKSERSSGKGKKTTAPKAKGRPSRRSSAVKTQS